MMKLLPLLALAVVLTACSIRTQTTSGHDYLARFDADKAAARQIGKRTGQAKPGNGADVKLDPAIKRAASVEPLLRFPARLGLARLFQGRLTAVPAEEADLWAKLVDRNRGLGSFDVVDPLVAHSTANTGCLTCSPEVGRIVETIRLGAARQHLDAVLIYEVGAKGGSEANGLAFMDLTIIGGAILPTRSIEVEGVAKALLLDVRNGYPYGSATASVDLSSLSPSWGSDARAERLRRDALTRVTASLIPEVETMFKNLRTGLNQRKR